MSEPDKKPFRVFASFTLDVMAPSEQLEEGYLRCMAGLIENYSVRPGDTWTAQPPKMTEQPDKSLLREVRIELVRTSPRPEDLALMEPAPAPSIIEEPEQQPAPPVNRETYEKNIMAFARRAVNHFNGLPKDPTKKGP